MTTEPSNPEPAAHLGARDAVAAGLLVAVACAATWDAWADVWRLGTTHEELGYVLLAPIMIGWLTWARRRELPRCRRRGGWLGLGVIAVGWAAYWNGFLTDPFLWRAGAVVVAVGAAVAAVGTDAVRRFAAAFGAAAFLVPVSPMGRYRVAEPLQVATARITEIACDAIGVSVHRAGNMLSINDVDVTIAEACNGMRMILTLFMVCYVVAFAGRTPAGVRALVLLASPVVAVVANVIRLVPTVWMFGNRSVEAAERFHDVGGWVMTGAAFGVLMAASHGLTRLLRRGDAGRAGVRSMPGPAVTRVTACP